MLALKLVLGAGADKSVQKIQIIHDILLVIEWMKGERKLENFNLRPFKEILNIKNEIADFFMLVYRERKRTADLLSKEGLQMATRYWHR